MKDGGVDPSKFDFKLVEYNFPDSEWIANNNRHGTAIDSPLLEILRGAHTLLSTLGGASADVQRCQRWLLQHALM